VDGPRPDICLLWPCRPGNGCTRLVLSVTCPRCLRWLLGAVHADLIDKIEQLRASGRPAA
jgi:hypothetical protein